ncbi:MAG TPA: ornithine cyclodeaminase family protein [Actinomycetota bacterium]|nr:ornithine cyclodeaminase family protein [Actinomycetota bacterium]
MSEFPFIDADRLGRLLSMEAAIDALEAAFGSDALPAAPLRTHIETGAGSLVAMPATGPLGTGVKLLTVTPGNAEVGRPLIQGLYVLFSVGTQEPEAAIDGEAITALRTGAVSGLATRYLARDQAAHLVIFGAGTQARAHLDAMLAVRPIDRVTFVSRTAGRAEALAGSAREMGVTSEVAGPDAVRAADIVCTCTTSPTPVFEGSLLSAGSHVNAIGAYTPQTRELDDETIRRGRVVVETREVALAEAGDLLIPLGAGSIGPDHVVADLSEVVRGVTVRRSPEDVTVFKSVGVAFEDLVVARAAVDRLGA